jgi:Rrf2 family protein
MLYSMATGYALRALSELPEDGTYVLAKDLAARVELPGPYLAKVLQTLAHAGVLESMRGPHGGFRLARPAAGITVGEVVGILNAMDTTTVCVMGFTDCLRRGKACPLHAAWCEAKATLDQTMAEVTIGDLYRLDLSTLKVVPRVKCQAAISD